MKAKLGSGLFHFLIPEDSRDLVRSLAEACEPRRAAGYLCTTAEGRIPEPGGWRGAALLSIRKEVMVDDLIAIKITDSARASGASTQYPFVILAAKIKARLLHSSNESGRER